MTPYQLKRSILFNSIQGKLVPQIVSEGTGNTLLIENRNRVQKMSSDLQKRVGKGCKAIKEGEPQFEIPESWDWERFGNLIINFDSQRRPVTKSDRKTTKGLYDYYGATGAIDRVDDWIFDGEYLMIGEDGGNFFVDRDNSFIARGRFWANNHVHVVKPIVCEISYLKICLDAYDLPNMGLINGIAVPKLNQENMNSILIPIPPLAEQKRIIAKIEELLPLIDRYEQAWNRLEDLNKRFPMDLQKSILQLAIQGKLVPQRPEEGTGEELYQQIQAEKQALIKAGKLKKEKPLPEITEEEIPFEIPESWKWIRLGAITELVTSGSRDWAQYYAESGDIFLRMGNLSRNSFNLRLDKIQHVRLPENAEGQRTALQAGDLLFSITGEVGTLGLIPEDFSKAYINQHTAIIRFLSSIRNRYVPYLLLTDYAHKYYNGNQHGIKNSFRLDTILLMPIPFPPLSEQKRIIAMLEKLLPLCERMK